jgi:hypothetical protein
LARTPLPLKPDSWGSHWAWRNPTRIRSFAQAFQREVAVSPDAAFQLIVFMEFVFFIATAHKGIRVSMLKFQTGTEPKRVLFRSAGRQKNEIKTWLCSNRHRPEKGRRFSDGIYPHFP